MATVRNTSRVLSVDPLSTTSTSHPRPGGVSCSTSASSVTRSLAPRLYVALITETALLEAWLIERLLGVAAWGQCARARQARDGARGTAAPRGDVWIR